MNTEVNAKLSENSLSKFAELGIEGSTLKAIKSLKFSEPTEIQTKAIPMAMAGKDIIASSETGSGKTLAFGAGILKQVKQGQGVQGLILTPTRELAEQVAENLKIFANRMPLKIAAVFGGASINIQIKELKKAEIVVATPGRLLDHISRGTIRLNKVATLVLDEADTMFDMGFINDVEKIIRVCPKNRQTLLFSATITREVSSLAKRHTKNAVDICTESYVDPGKLTQVCYDVSSSSKFPLLVHLLKNEETELSMVFCNTRRITDLVTKKLRESGISAKAIHGGFSQSKRQQTIKHFHAKKVPVLICTDVAARGLDINGVSHVFNYDIPKDGKQYIHRIGRTARAGKVGKAISILSKRDEDNFSRVVWENALVVDKMKMPDLRKPQVRPSYNQ